MTDTPDALSFEDSFSELDTIVRRLESGELPLEESVALYERGRLLAAHCQRLLDGAELRITQVTNGESS
ncbi:MAG: exodeoxyribonuclease VII small subunit [Anaerolineae bacterium]|nr:exodeoxyribonuclease VII small subunit [Anaerolineae bacterium]